MYAIVNGLFNVYGVVRSLGVSLLSDSQDWLYKRSYISLTVPTQLTLGSNAIGAVACAVSGLVFVAYYWHMVTGQNATAKYVW